MFYTFIVSFLASFLGPTSFQFPVTPIQEGIMALHAFIMVYGVGIIVFVLAMLFFIVYAFRSTRFDISDIVISEPVAHLEHYAFLHSLRNVKHGVNLEIIWTLTPAFILVSIALPSLELLYAMDEIIEPQLTIKVGGRQWYWNYTYTDWPSEMETRFKPTNAIFTLDDIKDMPIEDVLAVDEFGLLGDLSEPDALDDLDELDIRLFNIIAAELRKLVIREVLSFYAPSGFDFVAHSAYDNSRAGAELNNLFYTSNLLQLVPSSPAWTPRNVDVDAEGYGTSWGVWINLGEELVTYRNYIGIRISDLIKGKANKYNKGLLDRISISGADQLFQRYYWENIGSYTNFSSIRWDESSYCLPEYEALLEAVGADLVYKPFFTPEEPKVIGTPYAVKEGWTTYDRFVDQVEDFLISKTHRSNRVYSYDSYMIAESSLKEGEPRLLKTDKPLVAPSRVHIRFLVTSNDVLHSFAIPAAGIKIDAVPGRLNQVSAYFLYEGTFFGQCSELCGVNHGFMPIEVKVLKPGEFLQWRLDHKNAGFEDDFLA